MGIDNGPGLESIIKPVEKIDGIQREKDKQTKLNEQYLKLTQDQKNNFPQKQNEVVGFFGKLINSKEDLNNFLPEEQKLIIKTREFVEEQKRIKPDESVKIGGFAQEEDKLVYDNLINRWTLAEIIKPEKNSFDTFKKGNGETNGDFWWFQSVNEEADKMKAEGKFKWGDERIYFDIPRNEMEKMAKLTEEIAAKEKIAIGFKYLDLEKTAKVNLDGSETRFVANFASVEEAKRFYESLAKNQEYQNIKSDRSIDYLGYKIDDKANYANGFREKRIPLKNIIETAIQNDDGTYSYYGKETQKLITISDNQYLKFKQEYEALPDPKLIWEKAVQKSV